MQGASLNCAAQSAIVLLIACSSVCPPRQSQPPPVVSANARGPVALSYAAICVRALAGMKGTTEESKSLARRNSIAGCFAHPPDLRRVSKPLMVTMAQGSPRLASQLSSVVRARSARLKSGIAFGAALNVQTFMSGVRQGLTVPDCRSAILSKLVLYKCLVRRLLISTALPLALVVAGGVPAAYAGNDTETGTAGTNGANGVNPGDPGQPGTAGGPASAGSSLPITDPTNTATASGGTGGTGGNGVPPGGNAGAGDDGGAATATATTSILSGPQPTRRRRTAAAAAPQDFRATPPVWARTAAMAAPRRRPAPRRRAIVAKPIASRTPPAAPAATPTMLAGPAERAGLRARPGRAVRRAALHTRIS